MTPLLSIIIPHRHSVEAACRTLLSIPRDIGAEKIEIHVQDCDGRATELETLRQCHPSARVVSGNDTGIYDGINLGIAATTGQYILILGAGDRLRDDALGEILPLLREYQPSAMYGDVFMEDLKIRYRGRFQPADFFKFNVCQQGLFYARWVFAELGMFQTCYPLLADYEFNVRLFARYAAGIHYWDGIVADYQGAGASAANWRSDPFIAERAAFVASEFGISAK